MNTKLILGAAVAAVAVFSQGAFAQASSPTRAEVKAQAKTGSIAPAGEGPGAMAGSANTTGHSTKSRMMRKENTKAAEKAGALVPAGEGPGAMAGSANTTGHSTKSRMMRKDETKAEAKAGTLVPAGEAMNPIAIPQKK